MLYVVFPMTSITIKFYYCRISPKLNSQRMKYFGVQSSYMVLSKLRLFMGQYE